MKVLSSAFAFLSLCSITLFAEIPNVDDFRQVPQFPQPGEFAFGVTGTTMPDGRFILWNGDTVYLQAEPGSHELIEIATGYPGDPAFVALAPNGTTVALAAGFSGDLFLLDINNPVDGADNPALLLPSHFSGAYLNDSLLILDRGNDGFTASELIVVDLTPPAPTDSIAPRGRVGYSVLRLPTADLTRDLVVEKPLGSYSGGIHIDSTRTFLYVMDANVRELRQFSVAALIEAYDNATTLDWAIDGTLIGQPGDFLSGGVAGINPDGELIIPGSTGFGNPGGIQYVDPMDPAMILATIDPVGTQPFYSGIYNPVTDELIAIDGTFGQPLAAYARTTAIAAIPPETPCAIYDDVLQQWEDFGIQFDLDPVAADINGDTIADEAFILLVKEGACNTIDAIGEATRVAYDLNLDSFDAEGGAAAIADYRELIAILMLMSQDMQNDLLAFLTNNGTTLTQNYTSVTCANTGDCAPDFVEKPIVLDVNTRAIDEPYSAEGDFDGDGVSNLTEYENTIANGGDASDFVIAAVSPELDGTGAIRPHASNGGCFIATAAFGTPMAGEIDALRNVRDTWLLDNLLGATFVDTYYRISPPMADAVAQSPALRTVVRLFLMPILLLAKLFNAAPLLMFIMTVSFAGFGLRRSLRLHRTQA